MLDCRAISYSIAVGMPGDVSYAFDAATCVLRAAWKGGFIDVKSDWSGRGGNGCDNDGRGSRHARPAPPRSARDHKQN